MIDHISNIYFDMKILTRLFRSTLATLAIWAPVHGESDTKTIFDLPLKSGVTVNSEAIKDLLPASVFQVRKSMTSSEVAKILSDFKIQPLSRHPVVRKWLMGVTPRSAYLENLNVHWEDRRICKLELYANRLPPSEGQLKRWVSELQRCLGEPHMAFHKLNFGRENPRTLILEWKNKPETFRLSMEANSKKVSLKFSYYPGPNNPAIPRINRIPPKPIQFESLENLLSEFIDKIDLLPSGNGPHPALQVPKSEAALLKAYSEANYASALDTRDAEQYWRPYTKRITRSLNDHYSDKKKPALFKYLVQITEGKVQGLRSGEHMVGAAHFLASHDDSEVIDFLFRGMKVELPSGVRHACAKGIARKCTGKLLDQVLAMLLKPDRNADAIDVLLGFSSQRQLDELKSKAPSLDASLHEQVGAVISMLSRRELSK
ncbi:MAG: hypothetical protein AB8F34_05900 [Akkermansiaceae bacterium]